ncbi:hypothetical protein [Nocardiopsis sp. SBT366]|uniref:hypothetical protein n=1 Tax=Nocardiopsis sp. SBT366 TaxID=1580529 RepID=UPI000A8DCD08|nr:hypothetical protein [Nocardiopsis sp. SBT366]
MCVWSAEFANGTLGSLRVAYSLPWGDDGPNGGVEEAQRDFEEKRESLAEGYSSAYRLVQEARALEIGDESFVTHFLEGSEEQGSVAQVHVRDAEYLVEVTLREVWEDQPSGVDFTLGEEVLISIAERAVDRLEDHGRD